MDDIKVIAAILAAASLGSQSETPLGAVVDRNVDILRQLARRNNEIVKASYGGDQLG